MNALSLHCKTCIGYVCTFASIFCFCKEGIRNATNEVGTNLSEFKEDLVYSIILRSVPTRNVKRKSYISAVCAHYTSISRTELIPEQSAEREVLKEPLNV
jgi:hypothetical protein